MSRPRPSRDRADASATQRSVTPALLRQWRLPLPAGDGDKEERGRLLIVAGAVDNPGAAILAATAALRAGVGKVSIATAAAVTAIVAQAVPEARVVPIEPAGRRGIAGTAHADFDAVLIGPGMEHSAALTALVRRERSARPGTAFILDAGAIEALRNGRRRILQGESNPHYLVTPHAGEMAKLLGLDKEALLANAPRVALDFAKTHNVVIALKGALTVVASPARESWIHQKRNIALATSGSGDVLAGIIAGLAARGATLPQAAVWGVALHAMAGDRLVSRFGALGALAREIPHEVPALMQALRPRK